MAAKNSERTVLAFRTTVGNGDYLSVVSLYQKDQRFGWQSYCGTNYQTTVGQLRQCTGKEKNNLNNHNNLLFI
jgi:hypothetical protein